MAFADYPLSLVAMLAIEPVVTKLAMMSSIRGIAVQY